MSEIKALEERLAQSKAQLVAVIAAIEAKPEDIDCAANARRVLSLLQNGQIADPSMESPDVRLLRRPGRRRAAKTG